MLKLPCRASIVVEICEDCIKVGLAGDNRPRFVLSTHVDQPTARDSPLDLRLHYGNLFRRFFHEILHVKTKLVSVLVVEPLYWPSSHRDAVFTCLTIDFQVVSLSMQPSLMMSVVVSGVTAGIIINIGRNTSEVLCFSNSRLMIMSYKSIPLGVCSVCKSLLGRESAKIAELEKVNIYLVYQNKSLFFLSLSL